MEKELFYEFAPAHTERNDIPMPVQYKIDIMAALKEKGYSTYKLRKEKLLGESVITQLRNSELVSWANIARLCDLLECQPGDFLKYIPE